MLSTLRLLSARIDGTFTVPLTPQARRNMYMELLAALIFLSWVLLMGVQGTPATPQNLPIRRSLRARWPLRWRCARL